MLNLFIFLLNLIFFQVRSEAEILKCLKHPNIIQLKEFIADTDPSYHILILEYFDAITLKDYIQDNSCKSEHFQIIFSQIYNGLMYLHSKQIVHRDFNINNILINPSTLEIKIIDFGLARFTSQMQYMYSPHGNVNYRIPVIDSLMNPYFEDVWNFAGVGLSLLRRKKMTSKKIMRLLEKFQKKPEKIEDCEKDISKILGFIQVALQDACQEKEVYEFSDVKSPLEDFNV